MIKTVFQKLQLWFVSHAFGWFVALLIGIGLKERMSHNKGIAGKGKIKIVDNPDFPEHEFFQPGKSFDCRVRHASVTFKDDAMNQVRGISIKFADSRFKSPLDLEANTGKISIFWTAANFLEFVWNRREKDGIQYKAYYEKEPDGFLGAQESGKHKPSSFALLDYYSKTPMRFKARSGEEYAIKYRVIPGELPIEPADIPEEQKVTVYDQRIDKDEKDGVNYLVDEYKKRVESEPVKYKLQLQLQPLNSSVSETVFDSRINWDESKFPWKDLATIEIDELLPYEETVKMGFNIKNHPPSLGFLPAKSIHDFNSIVYMRSKTVKAYHTRNMAYAIFGLPKPTPDNAPRNK